MPAVLRPPTTPGAPVEDLGSGDPHPDLLGWLGFAPGDTEDEPLLTWPRPAVWPSVRRSPRGRHGAMRPRAA